jgi:probable H4MPT-linked C1 transfer pathway protein
MHTPLLAAASNWRALAAFAARFAATGTALLLDVGSTTTDIIPLQNGEVAATGFEDTDRLLNGELAYTGVERTPICAVASSVPYRDRDCPVAGEVFATTLDAYLLTGDLPENTTQLHTADRRPATKVAARLRMSRMIGAPEEKFNHRDAVIMSQHIRASQVARIAASVQQVMERVGGPPESVIACGQGEFLVQHVLGQLNLQPRVVSFAHTISLPVSRAGPAHALAVLAREASGR